MAFGIAVHQVLYSQFERWASSRVRDEESGFDVLTNRGVNTILRARGAEPYGRPLGLVRPDLIDLETQRIYEIKPIQSAHEGAIQMAAYLSLLNARDPGWLPGWDFKPTPRFFSVKGDMVLVAPSVGGLILYGRAHLIEVTAVGIAALTAAASRIMLPSAMPTFSPVI